MIALSNIFIMLFTHVLLWISKENVWGEINQ